MSDVSVEATSLTLIVSAVTGWTSITNQAAASPGFIPGATASQLDKRGALVGQRRPGGAYPAGVSDADYLAIILLTIAARKSRSRTVDWSRIVAVLLTNFSGDSEVQYREGNASFEVFVGDIQLDPALTAQVLAEAVPNGIGPAVLAYTTWPDGNDFMWGSTYDASAGEGAWGSAYDGTIGGLLAAAQEIA